MTEYHASVLIDGIKLPVTPFLGDEYTPCALTPIVITWGRKSPTDQDNAPTLDLTLRAGRPGWSNATELIGRPITVRYRDPDPEDTDWGKTRAKMFDGHITDVTVDHGTDTRYHVKASGLAYALSRDPRKPAVMAPPYLATSMTGLRFLNEVYGTNIDFFRGPLFFNEAYSNADKSVLAHRVETVDEADNVLDITRSHHIMSGEQSEDLNGTYAWAELWDCSATGEAVTGFTERRVIGEYTGWIGVEGQDGLSHMVSADKLRIKGDELIEPTPYREIQWTSQRKDGDGFKDHVTTIPLDTGTRESFFDILAIKSNEPNAPGDTIHSYEFSGPIDVTHLKAEVEHIGTRSRLPTLIADWNPDGSENNMPDVIRPERQTLLIVGSKYENTDPRTHGWWLQSNGTLTYMKDPRKGMIWRHEFDVWPIPGPDEHPTIADFKAWTPSGGTYRGSSLSENILGLFRYVNTFKETA